MDSGRLQPALFGGIFIGVLSALPVVNAGNCCCCLWVILGGVLATYLRQQNTPYAVTAAEGALVGLMAGAIGGVLAAVLSIPMQALTGDIQRQFLENFANNPDLPPEFRDALTRGNLGGAAMAAGIMFNMVISVVFGLLGGLLGTAIFKKSAPPPPPPGTVEVLPPE